MNVNSWLRNIQGQISELASEVMQEATTEVEDPESELQVERKKCAEAEKLLVLERSKAETLEKRVTQLEEQLYTSNLENDAIKERFEHMIADRDAQLRQFEIDAENLHDELKLAREREDHLRTSLREKEAEVASVREIINDERSRGPAGHEQMLRKSSQDTTKSHPLSESGTEASNNGGWEKMGTEWTAAPEAIVSSTSSEGCGGGSEGAVGLLGTDVELATGVEVSSPQHSSPRELATSEKGTDPMCQRQQENELKEALANLSTARDELDEQRMRSDEAQRKVNRLESELSERSTLLDEMTTLLGQKTEELCTKDADIARMLAEHGSETKHLRSQLADALSSRNEAVQQCELLNENEARREELGQEKSHLESRVEELQAERAVQMSQVFQLTEELAGREEVLERTRARATELERLLAEAAQRERVENKEEKGDVAQCEELKLRNAELVVALENEVAARSECEERLKALEQQVSEKEKHVVVAEQDSRERKGQMASLKEELDRRDKEVVRLREHLVQIEEYSTKEAVLAEERETQLRKELHTLRESSCAKSSSAAESENYYKEEIASLRTQLISAEESVAQLRATINDREQSLNEVTKSLTSLQAILQELGEDHIKEMAQRDEELKSLQNESRHEVTVKENELNQTRRSFEDRERAYEVQLNVLNVEVGRRAQAIEELENQLDELKGQLPKGTKQSGNPPSVLPTYRVDDATLRQLFMSYLLAERDKQPEIATVLASILNYSPEEQDLIQEAVFSEGLGSWFGFGGGSRRSAGRKGKKEPEPSLAEQFIRFLETESLRLEEQPTLPIPQSPQPTQLTDVVTIGDKGMLREQPTASSSDLKSILETP